MKSSKEKVKASRKPARIDGHDLRQHDLPERRQRRRIEIARGLDDVAAEAGDPRLDDHRHQRQREQPVGGDDRAVAEPELRRLVARPDAGEQRVERRRTAGPARPASRCRSPRPGTTMAAANSAVEDRARCARPAAPCRVAAMVPKTAASAGAGEGDDQAVLQRLDQEAVGQRLAVPGDRKAGELAGAAAGVEREQHDQRDRRIEETDRRR